jgi:hypothetical protein
MEGRTREDAKQAGRLLFLVFLFVVFFLVIIIFFQKVAVLAGFAFALFVIVIIQFIGNDVEVHGVRLRDFELRLALGAAQNLALFHFVFVNIDFG